MKGSLSNAKIYKITNDHNNDIYIGSTTSTLIKRFSQHKCDAIRERGNFNRPLYVLINEIGIERFRIELIEDCPCEDIYQLRQNEARYIRQFGTLNTVKNEGANFKDNKTEYRTEYNKKTKVCECGQVIKLNYYSHHIKTKRHLENL